jgi:hypothetical protein
VLRFVEEEGALPRQVLREQMLPGLKKEDATFDGHSQKVYFDHWVSNVHSRVGYLDTLKDTLMFSPKVEFNAGVVAAGEAQIESTVTGNTPESDVTLETALIDHSQIYLPTNNALTEVGHVSLFLKQLGQGIQHIAMRVKDLPEHIQRINDSRKMTGGGFTFLQIPPSYYGYISASRLAKSSGLDTHDAEKCMVSLQSAGVVSSKGIVDLDAARPRVEAALRDATANAKAVADHVLRARYGNLYELLGDRISEDMYLRIVRNNILVDIQGEDLLLQIFTAKILQRSSDREAPFYEFIQRVCSDALDPITGKPKAIKAGCGGFGIRNFLTLFLSIEIGKAFAARDEAKAVGDKKAEEYASRMVDLFTEQMDLANPILTAISDAMTAEGSARDLGKMEIAKQHEATKNQGSEDLKALSIKYSGLMKELREQNRS